MNIVLGYVQLRATLVFYLESVFAVYVVIGLHGCNDITGQRDATKHCFLPAVCEATTHTHRILLQALKTTSYPAKII